jgi:HK97 family phage major capsid protein
LRGKLITGGVVKLPLTKPFPEWDNSVSIRNSNRRQFMPIDIKEWRHNLDADLRPVLSKYFPKNLDEATKTAGDTAIEIFKSKNITRKVPGESSGDNLNSKGGKYYVNKDSEYSSTIKFFRDIMVAGSPGGDMSDELRGYVKKTNTLMEEGDLSQGGYALPSDTSSQILEKALEMSIVRPRATLQPMSSNKLELPADMDEDHSSNYFSGITIYRPGEGEQKTGTNPVLGKVKLQLHKLVGYVEVTDELLEDAPALEAWLIRKFSQAVAFVEDSDFLVGDGANKALGMFNASNPSLITASAESGQGASTIVAENIASMWAQLWPEGQSRAVWVANINTFKQLFKMGLAVGTGGIPVWMPANQLSGRPYKELMGQPIFFTEKMQSLGTAGDIGVADMSQYLVGDRGGLKVASSIHVKFDYDRTAFRFVLRYDGTPSWLTTLTPQNGSDALSPFVILSGSRT